MPVEISERTRVWADGYESGKEYVDPAVYFGRRLALFEGWGPPNQPGDHVLQIGCGDGYFAELLLDRGYRVTACDHAQPLLDKTARRCESAFQAGTLGLQLLDINQLPLPVQGPFDQTFAIMRSFFHYSKSPRQTLKELAGMTRKKLLVDLDPREYTVESAKADLLDSGFRPVSVRAFLTPQKRRLNPLLQKALDWSETIPWIYRPIVRKKFQLWILAVPCEQGEASEN